MQAADALQGPHAALAEFVITKLDGETDIRIASPVGFTETPIKQWPIISLASHHSVRNLKTGRIRSSSDCCWHDAHPIDTATPVVFLPVAHDDVRNLFWVYGRFCSFRCAMKFAFTHQVTCPQYTTMLLQLLAYRVYDWPVGLRISAAPARESLSFFGNTGRSMLSLQQFRKTTTATTNYRKPPFLQTDNLNANVEHILLYKAFGDTDPYIMMSNFRSEKKPDNSVCCWHDTYLFDGPVVGVPISISIQPDAQIYSVYGCFCSFECALGYLMEHKDWNVDEQIVLLHRLASIGPNGPNNGIAIVQPAPPAWELVKFGGSIEIDDFRETYCTTKSSQLMIDHCVWVTTAIEYQTMTLPSPDQYVSLRNISIMSTAAPPETSEAADPKRSANIEDLMSAYLSATTDPEQDFASVDALLDGRTGTTKKRAPRTSGSSAKPKHK